MLKGKQPLGDMGIILRTALTVFLILLFGSHASAQEDRPAFKMPCPQVLKLGLDKFTEAYGEKTQDYSTYGQKQALGYYVDCKRPANDALAATTLSETRRKQLDAVREEYNKFGTALWGLKYLESGGGTMWGLISVSSYAEREDFMEILIKALAMPDQKSPRGRQRVNANLVRIRKLLSARDRRPFTEGAERDDIAQQKTSYTETMKETRDALAQLQSVLRSLPDNVADRLATHMANLTKNALVDSE